MQMEMMLDVFDDENQMILAVEIRTLCYLYNVNLGHFITFTNDRRANPHLDSLNIIS